MPYVNYGPVDALTNGTFWNLDSSKTLSWALSDFGPYSWNNPASTSTIIGQAYATFSAYIPVNFSYKGYFTQPNSAPADLVVSLDGSNTFFSSSSVWAEGFFPNPNLTQSLLPSSVASYYPNAPGDIWLNINSQLNSLSSYAPGSGGFFALLHEMGHTLGLKHTHDDGGTGHPTLASVGLGALDFDWFSIMSYVDSYPLTSIAWHPATPMIGDVLALQSIYGANLSVHQGNDIYSIVNNNMFQTIFDALGSNTLDARGSSHSWKIDLSIASPGVGHPYQIGLANPSDENLAVPSSLYWLYGIFETIYCSNQNDAIICSPTGNVIYGLGGNDSIDGGSGIDTAVYSGTAASHTITNGSSTATVVDKTANRDGTDTLTNVERLSFTDTMVALDTGANQTAGNAYLLYQAAFNRTPDTPGLGYWIAQMDKGANVVTQVAENFILGNEFKGLYGSSPTVDQFTNLLYVNVLHRSADTAGLKYWEDQFAGTGFNLLTQAQTLNNFAISNENQANAATQIAQGIHYQAYVG